VADKLAIPVPEIDSATSLVSNHAFSSIDTAVYDMSITGMFTEADIVVKAVIILLLAASFWSWTIIFDKLFRFRKINKKMSMFEQDIWDGEALEDRYERTKYIADHPMARVFVAGMYVWLKFKKKGLESIRPSERTREGDYLRTGIKERIFYTMDIARNREVGAMESNLSFLATVGATAPFVGLFGTVWGIMNSFQSIAMMHNTTLAVVAPGIAEALFATAVGLFTAIPAVIFYNKFANNVANFSDRLDEFSGEFAAVISRKLGDD